MKLSRLIEAKPKPVAVKAKEGDYEFEKMKKGIPAGFVTLLQMVGAMRAKAFELGQNDVYRQAQTIETELTTMYRKLEQLQDKLGKAINK